MCYDRTHDFDCWYPRYYIILVSSSKSSGISHSEFFFLKKREMTKDSISSIQLELSFALVKPHTAGQDQGNKNLH